MVRTGAEPCYLTRWLERLHVRVWRPAIVLNCVETFLIFCDLLCNRASTPIRELVNGALDRCCFCSAFGLVEDPLNWVHVWRMKFEGSIVSMFTQELLFCRVLPSLYLWIFKCWRGWRKGSARSHSSPPWEDEKPWTMAICCLVVRQWEGNRWPFAPLRKAVPVVRKAGFSYWILRPRLIACWVAALVVNVVTSSQVNIVNSDEAVSGFYPSSVGWTVGVQRSEDGWWAPTRCRWSSSWCPSAGQLGCHWWPADCWWWYIPVDETELTEVEKKNMKKKNKLKTKPTKAQMQRPARIASYQPSPQFSDFPRLPPTSTPRRRVPSRSCRIWDRWSISSSPTSEVQRL